MSNHISGETKAGNASLKCCRQKHLLSFAFRPDNDNAVICSCLSDLGNLTDNPHSKVAGIKYKSRTGQGHYCCSLSERLPPFSSACVCSGVDRSCTCSSDINNVTSVSGVSSIDKTKTCTCSPEVSNTASVSCVGKVNSCTCYSEIHSVTNMSVISSRTSHVISECRVKEGKRIREQTDTEMPVQTESCVARTDTKRFCDDERDEGSWHFSSQEITHHWVQDILGENCQQSPTHTVVDNHSVEQVATLNCPTDMLTTSGKSGDVEMADSCGEEGEDDLDDDFDDIPSPGCYADGDESSIEDDQSVISTLTVGSSSSLTPSLVGESLGSISISEQTSQEAQLKGVLSSGDTVANTLHPPLRYSLFSHVPPTINFCMHNEKNEELPPAVQKHLRWRLSTITPVVVRRTLSNSNFKLSRKALPWVGTWGKHMKSNCFRTVESFQKVNHFPGTFQIGRKDKLWKNLAQLQVKFGKREFGFIPRTFILPQDMKALRQSWKKDNGQRKWIIKPPASARGTGIKVVQKWTQVPKNRPLIVQRYVSRPYLINGTKFDLRLYVYVTSFSPLRIYLYDDGLVRFASVKYCAAAKSLSDRYMHLTNYSINKNSVAYTQNEDASACHGHKWTLKALWGYLRERSVDTDLLWRRMVDMVIKTIISGEAHITTLLKSNVSSQYSCHELFGFDILIDEKLRPWLLEVNISPSLHSTSSVDLCVKGPLIKDLFNVAMFHLPDRLSHAQQFELGQSLNAGEKVGSLCLDRRLYTMSLSAEERTKQVCFRQKERSEYLPTILNELSPDDVRQLVIAEEELARVTRFHRVFPTASTYVYHHYFENPRYYNMIFDAWENNYGSCRQKGIELLEGYCQQKHHLRVPPNFAGSKASVSRLNRLGVSAKRKTKSARCAQSAAGRPLACRSKSAEKDLQPQISQSPSSTSWESVESHIHNLPTDDQQ